MAENRTVADLFIDVSRNRLVTPSGSTAFQPLTETYSFYRGSQILFRCKIYVGDQTTAFVTPENSTWLFGIDDSFTRDKDDLVISEDDQFNIEGDWSESDPENGIVCWRADLTTQALKDSVGDDAAKSMYACLWMTPPSGEPTLMAQWNITINNIAVDPTSVSSSEGIVFITSAAAKKTYVPIWGDKARWRWKTGGWQYRFEEDEKWRSMLPIIHDGHPVISWGEAED